jgi:cytolysin-activating lysine-acyltransferase
MSRVTSDENTESAEYNRTLGCVTSLMLQNKNYRSYPMACLLAWIHTPILLKQLRVFFNERGVPVGYLTWAFLAPDVELKWTSDPKVLLHFSEWNEGENLWIMDFLATHGYARAILDTVKLEMFDGYREAKSIRRNPDGSARNVTTWRVKRESSAPSAKV